MHAMPCFFFFFRIAKGMDSLANLIISKYDDAVYINKTCYCITEISSHAGRSV